MPAQSTQHMMACVMPRRRTHLPTPATYFIQNLRLQLGHSTSTRSKFTHFAIEHCSVGAAYRIAHNTVLQRGQDRDCAQQFAPCFLGVTWIHQMCSHAPSTLDGPGRICAHTCLVSLRISPGNIVRDRTNRHTHHTRMAGSLSWTQHNTRRYDVRAGSLIQAQKPPNLSSCSRQHDNARQVHQTPWSQAQIRHSAKVYDC